MSDADAPGDGRDASAAAYDDHPADAPATDHARRPGEDVPDRGLAGARPEERPQPSARRNAQGIRVDPDAEATPAQRTAVISALVDHEPGVLSRVSGLFSRRQFNIESLTVGPTTVAGHARITLVIEESDPGIDQAKKQLAKLPPVIAVGELDDDAVRAELVLLKVRGDEPDKVHAVTRMYEGQTLDAGPRTITVQITGDERKIDDAVDAFRQFGIIEIARTGQTALARGDSPTTPGEEPGHSAAPVEAAPTADGVEATGVETASDASGTDAATPETATDGETASDATPNESTTTDTTTQTDD